VNRPFKAKGKRQKAKGKRQKANGKRLKILPAGGEPGEENENGRMQWG
jgi:hypothetical protein